MTCFSIPKLNKDSTLGVPGLMRAWLKGNIALAIAPGAGVADGRVVYCAGHRISKKP